MRTKVRRYEYQRGHMMRNYCDTNKKSFMMQEQGGRTGQAWHSALAFLQVVNTCALDLIPPAPAPAVAVNYFYPMPIQSRKCTFRLCLFNHWCMGRRILARKCSWDFFFFSFQQKDIWRTEFNQTDSFITESGHKNVWLLKFNWFHKTLVEI